MPSQINAAQMALIDETWDDRQTLERNGRIHKRAIRSVTISCWRVGPREAVSAQLIGRLVATYSSVIAVPVDWHLDPCLLIVLASEYIPIDWRQSKIDLGRYKKLWNSCKYFKSYGTRIRTPHLERRYWHLMIRD
jgi:hypothetical protein